MLGWGSTQEGGANSEVLQGVNVHMMDTAGCNVVYSNRITQGNQICAGKIMKLAACAHDDDVGVQESHLMHCPRRLIFAIIAAFMNGRCHEDQNDCSDSILPPSRMMTDISHTYLTLAHAIMGHGFQFTMHLYLQARGQ